MHASWRLTCRVGRWAGILSSMLIRPMTTEDQAAVLGIYEDGIATGDATFESQVPSWESWDSSHLSAHRFVAVTDRVVGWVAASAVSGRCVYAGVIESSVYVASDGRGQGVGFELLSALVQSTEQAGIWTIQAGIFPENLSSIHIHEKAGFRSVGIHEKLGQMNGIWRDVVLMERRSSKI